MRLKLIWAILVDELFQKSKHKGLGNDTLKRCCLAVVTFVGFYFLVYHYDEQAIRFDQWLNEVFGWELSSVPSARKVEWHRLMAGGLSSVAIFAAVGEYSVCLWRRIKARPQESDLPARDQASLK